MTRAKFDLKALEYRANAEAASAAATASTLEHSRERHEVAARRWTELAEAEEGRAASARIRLAGAPPAD